MRLSARSLLRQVSLWLCLAAAGLGAPASAAPRSPALVAFDRAVEDAKAAMMSDPEHALAKSEIAHARARQLPPSPDAALALATAQWLRGEAYIYSNRVDAAAPIVEQTLREVERIAPRSKLRGDLLRSHGALAAMSGRIQVALRDFQLAYKVFAGAGEVRSQALTLQDIGLIYWDAGDYARVLQYYSQAGDLYTADPAFTLTSHNNQGEVLRKLGKPRAAAAEFEAALVGARKLGSALLQVRVLSNLAAVQVEAGETARAGRTIDTAMRLSRAGEAAGWKPFVSGVAAMAAAKRGDDRQAATYLERTFAGSDLTKTQSPFREFHEIAAQVYERLGDHDMAFRHLRAFQRLDSEARALTASTSAQLMSAQFDFSRQNLKIAQLKQAQLAADIQFRTILFTGLIIAGGIVFGVLLVGFVSIRRSRNEVRVANTVLTGVNTKLEKALKAKTEFLAMTSHEIRTPLNGILGMTQILLANRRVDGEMREQIAVVHGAGESMKALVDDILDVAKMETGEVATVAEPVDVRQVLTDTARLWEGHASAKRLALEVDIAGAPPRIVTDPSRFRQILSNLLSNAVKFTPEGAIALRAFVDGDAFVVAVRDTGVGIPREQQALIFEAFHQVDAGTTRQFSGTGLGLAICRNLAVTLGGTLDVESEVGTGSTFTLRLPFAIESEAADAPAERARPADIAQATLLLVEQNGLTQGIMRTLLEPVFGRMDCADSGTAALAALADGGIDHILIEARSGAVEGQGDPIASLRTLIAAAARAGITSTLLVAPSEDLPLGDLAELGASQLVLKPVGGAKLVAAVAECYASATPDMALAA